MKFYSSRDRGVREKKERLESLHIMVGRLMGPIFGTTLGTETGSLKVGVGGTLVNFITENG